MYVNDAFGAAHRAHASTAGVAAHVKHAVAGLLMQKELDHLYGALGDPATVKRPFVAIVGGFACIFGTPFPPPNISYAQPIF